MTEAEKAWEANKIFMAYLLGDDRSTAGEKLHRAFLAGYAAAHRWRSVEEEPPLMLEVVLGQRRCGEVYFVSLQSDGQFWGQSHVQGKIGDFVHDTELGVVDGIVRWQPLPEGMK